MKILHLMSVPPEQHDITWLIESLQAAIELEHATLPPYLCGLWSIKDGNGEVYDIISSIVMEEMLHIGLACNMLTTIGGAPVMNTPGFVPTYPCPLPGGVRPELTVRLQGLTREYVDQVYIQIEYPEQEPTAKSLPTIGSFYNAVLDCFKNLVNSGQVTITGQNQLTSNVAGGVYEIKTLADVENAITEIVEQGEGTLKTPETHPHDFGHHASKELAHYYKFAEIYHGRQLVQVNGQWKYEGKEIPFPETYPMAVVPKGGYPNVSSDFDELYSQLLGNLHDAWNGGGRSKLGQAVGIMFQLGTLAAELMGTAIDPNDPSKPTFPR